MKKLLGGLGLSLVVAGCGGRDAFWDTPVPDAPKTAKGSGAMAVLDEAASRVVMLRVGGDLELRTDAVQIGRSAAALKATPDTRTILALTRGDVPRRTASAEGPALTTIEAGPSPGATVRYQLSDPLSGLALDPENRFAVVYATAADEAFVSNPNELIFVDVTKQPSSTNPLPRTLRSFGGRPLRLDFTPELGLSTGARRLLVAQTDRDVTLVDLADLSAPEVTVRLVEGAKKLQPAEVAVSDGDPATPDDVRIALRLGADSNVVVLELGAPSSPEQGAFRTTPNIIALSAPPTDLAFVKTDGGERLAAMLPSRKAIALVDTATGLAQEVPLGDAMERIALVTDVVGAGSEGADAALVWSPTRSMIGLVSLGKTVGKPYKAIEMISLETPVANVRSVPGANARLKILETVAGTGFFVLDLDSRTVAPLVATRAGVRLEVAPDGGRAWVSAGTEELANVDLDRLHPENLLLTRTVTTVADVARPDGGRGLIALHAMGGLGVTLLDAKRPSLADAREYAGVLLGGAP